MNELKEILKEIKANGNPENVSGMQRFGIRFEKCFGCNIPFLRNLAKKYKGNHKLALELWKTEIHEARILSFLIEDPNQTTELQIETWLKDVKSWDICDGLCNNLIRKTKWAYPKIYEWIERDDEFQKRAGFVMMAVLAVHNKKADDEIFIDFLEIIEKKFDDERNFVKKAVNWALRQIGKRNSILNKKAIKTAENILNKDTKTGNWIATDAIRELINQTTKRMLIRREKTLSIKGTKHIKPYYNK